jgi:nudix-type nucleoside diphosphatase (YffH/AdpP family)
MKVIIKEKKREYEGFYTVEKCALKYERFNGKMSDLVIRENCSRGDSTGALVYDLNEKKIVLIRQFRYPVYSVEPDEAWLLELPAGSVSADEYPKDAIMRELAEEIHLDVKKEDVRLIGKYFSSPGGTSERVYLYAVECDLGDYDKKTGGVAEEQEDIEILVMPFRQVYEALSSEKIMDGKSIMALQWLEKQVMSFHFGG